MARRKVISLNVDHTVEWTNPGQSVEGYYIGSKVVESKLGKSKLHVFQGETGKFGIYGSYELDGGLLQVPAGFLTYVTYNGKVTIPGGKTMKKFDVDYDDEVSINVPNLANAELTRTSEVEESADLSANDVDDSVMEDDEEEESNPIQRPLSRTAAPVANTASAAKKSQIEAMLLGKTKR